MKNLKENEYYKVTLNSVECKDWDKYLKKCLQFSFYVPELGESARRTISFPKSLKPERNKFFRIFGPILKKHYPQQILEAPELFAETLDKDLSNNSYMALLKRSNNGKFIDVEALEPLGDG